MHCGYHLTTSIVAPALLSLPFAFASLGWGVGVACLVIGALVTFYSYNLLSMVLEHHAQRGRRLLRFRDMADDIIGKYVLTRLYDLDKLLSNNYSVLLYYSMHLTLPTKEPTFYFIQLMTEIPIHQLLANSLRPELHLFFIL